MESTLRESEKVFLSSTIDNTCHTYYFAAR